MTAWIQLSCCECHYRPQTFAFWTKQNTTFWGALFERSQILAMLATGHILCRKPIKYCWIYYDLSFVQVSLSRSWIDVHKFQKSSKVFKNYEKWTDQHGVGQRKIWFPERNRTHDLPSTGRALYPLSYEKSWRARSLTRVHLRHFFDIFSSFRILTRNSKILALPWSGGWKNWIRPNSSPFLWVIGPFQKGTAWITKRFHCFE